MTMEPFSTESIQKAREAGKRRRESSIWATYVSYNCDDDRLVLELANGWALAIDRNRIKEFLKVLPEKMQNVRLSPAGTALHLDEFDIHISVEGLISAIIPINSLARSVGRRGGVATSAAKAAASRENGARGGRPPKRRMDEMQDYEFAGSGPQSTDREKG